MAKRVNLRAEDYYDDGYGDEDYGEYYDEVSEE